MWVCSRLCSKTRGALRPYPNPANNTFTLALAESHTAVDVKIYDTAGRLVQDIPGFTHGQAIDFQEFGGTSGVFFISVFDTATKELIGKTRVVYLK